MCPPVSGITTKDSALSTELGMRALDLAVGEGALTLSYDSIPMEENSTGSVSALVDNGILRKGGHVVIKLLESEDGQGI